MKKLIAASQFRDGDDAGRDTIYIIMEVATHAAERKRQKTSGRK